MRWGVRKEDEEDDKNSKNHSVAKTMAIGLAALVAIGIIKKQIKKNTNKKSLSLPIVERTNAVHIRKTKLNVPDSVLNVGNQVIKDILNNRKK